MTAALTVYAGARGKLKGVTASPSRFLLIGLCTATMVMSHYMALSGTQVAYMISVKRTSLIFSVIYGKIVFNEERIRERLLGSVIMVAGVVLIVIF